MRPFPGDHPDRQRWPRRLMQPGTDSRGRGIDAGSDASIVTVVHEGRALPMTLERVSTLGCLAIGPGTDRLSIGDECTVNLPVGPQRVRRHWAQVEAVQGDRAWLTFRGPGFEQTWTLAASHTVHLPTAPGRAGATEVVVDAQRIQSMCHALTTNRCHGVLHTADGEVEVRGLATRTGHDLALLWQVAAPPRQPTMLVIHGPLSSFELPIRRHRFDGTLATDLPQHLTRTRRRRWQRIEVPGAEITFDHPHHPGLTIRARVHDLCRDGIAFDTDLLAEPVLRGLEIGHARIRLGDRTFDARLDVRHVTATRCGGRLQADQPDAWNDLVGARLHPGTRRGGISAAGLWQLYVDSNYFNLSGKSKLEFSARRRDYEAAHRKLLGSPQLACKTVYASRSEKYEAALTAARTYEHTWFGFHMAKRKGVSEGGVAAREVLRRLHLRTYEHVLGDPRARWVLGYVQHKPGLHFPRMVHVAFPEYCLPTGRSCVLTFRALQLASGRAARSPQTGYTTRRANPRDLDALADVIRRERPRPYVEALDLTRNRLRMSGIKKDWSNAGMNRDREIFVASTAGRAAAALVVESASNGVHLYGLLDCARLFALREGGENAFDALLEVARAWFADQGKPHFIYMREDGDLDARPRPDQVDLGKADLTVLSTELLPDFLEQMWEVTSKRPHTTTRAAN